MPPLNQRRNRAYLNPSKDRDRGPRPDLRLISGARSTDAPDQPTLVVQMGATATLARRGDEESSMRAWRLVAMGCAVTTMPLRSNSELGALTVELSGARADV